MKSFCVFLPLVLLISGCAETAVRVRNASATDFQTIVISGRSIGDIRRGETTAYQSWKDADHEPIVILMAADRVSFGGTAASYRAHGQPHVPLGAGRFTYVLTRVRAADHSIDVTIQKDSP